jgi:hypothetical protein
MALFEYDKYSQLCDNNRYFNEESSDAKLPVGFDLCGFGFFLLYVVATHQVLRVCGHEARLLIEAP